MSKHYIRIDQNNRIIKGFSDDFEEPMETDICINEDGGRHFEFLGNINPTLINSEYIYIYKYENGEVLQRTENEIEQDLATLHEASQNESVLSIEDLKRQLQEDKIQTQLAIAELASSLLGGE